MFTKSFTLCLLIACLVLTACGGSPSSADTPTTQPVPEIGEQFSLAESATDPVQGPSRYCGDGSGYEYLGRYRMEADLTIYFSNKTYVISSTTIADEEQMDFGAMLVVRCGVWNYVVRVLPSPTETPAPTQVPTPIFTPLSFDSVNRIPVDGIRGQTFYSLPSDRVPNCPSGERVQNLLVNFTGGQLYIEKTESGGRYIDSTYGEFLPIEEGSNHRFQFEREGGKDYLIYTEVEIQDCGDGFWYDASQFYAPWGEQVYEIESTIQLPPVISRGACIHDAKTYLNVWLNFDSATGGLFVSASLVSEGGQAFYRYWEHLGPDSEKITTGFLDSQESITVYVEEGPLTIINCLGTLQVFP